MLCLDAEVLLHHWECGGLMGRLWSSDQGSAEVSSCYRYSNRLGVFDRRVLSEAGIKKVEAPGCKGLADCLGWKQHSSLAR